MIPDPPRLRGRTPFHGGRWWAGLALALVLPACQSLGRVPAPPPMVAPPEIAGEFSIEADAAAAPLDLPLPPAPEPPPEPVADAILQSEILAAPVLRDQVDRWLRTWRDDQPHNFLVFLERRRTISSIVEGEIAARGLPASLAALPIVESGYAPGAANPSGAGGLWQIMPTTARSLGLEVSTTVDERRDPAASTRAALDYLTRHEAEFGSWLLAIAAYNAGSGTIANLVARAGGWREGESGDGLFLRIYDSLPGETRDLIARFLAAATLSSDPEGHGLPRPAQEPWSFEEVELADAVSLDVIARAAGVSTPVIEELNPHFLRGYLPGGEPRTVRIPAGTSERFTVAYALIPPSERITFVEHEVASGETFSHIARRYGVPLQEVVEANSGIDPRRLRIGTRVKVPNPRSP